MIDIGMYYKYIQRIILYSGNLTISMQYLFDMNYIDNLCSETEKKKHTQSKGINIISMSNHIQILT